MAAKFFAGLEQLITDRREKKRHFVEEEDIVPEIHGLCTNDIQDVARTGTGFSYNGELYNPCVWSTQASSSLATHSTRSWP